MAPRSRPPIDDGAEAQVAQTTPRVISTNETRHDFILQSVLEMQKSIGAIDAKLDAMKSSLDGVKGKVEDLVGWKNKILGGVAVAVAIFGVLWIAVKTASEYLMLKQAPAIAQPGPTAAVPTPPPVAVAKPPQTQSKAASRAGP